MKKLLRIAVVLGLVMCLSVSALAAGASTTGVKVDTAVMADGTKAEVTESASAVTPTTAEAAAAVQVEGVKADDLTVAWVKDISVTIPAGGSVTITFDVPNAAADQKVYVLHYNGNQWEKVGEGTGKTVKATFTSLSPVAIVVAKAPASNPGQTSPVTGEEPVLLVAAVVALLAGAVAVVTLKKKEM